MNRRYQAADGTVYHYRSEPAKGTYNQLVLGYAALMMHAFDALPPDAQRLAHDDLIALVLHVIDHDYRLTEKDGTPTKYGDMTPLLGTTGVPFNAQVAYMIVATGAHFPPADAAARERIVRQLRRLRDEHHVYYEDPRRHLIRPQTVGGSPFVKGMNDRNHVTNAAFIGLALELHAARSSGRQPDQKFLYELGQTMYHSMQELEDKQNSLCSFMWAGILSDPVAFAAIIPKRPEKTHEQLRECVPQGVQQLRHFPLDRFMTYGRYVETDKVQWVDRYHADYHWKNNPKTVFEPTGATTDQLTCAMDFLHAYWLMRLYKLENHPAMGGLHREVLGQ